MPIWLIVMVLGATGTGFLFLKARQIEKAAPYKKVKQGSITLKKRARLAAARPSTMEVRQPLYSEEAVNMSADLPSNIARELEEIQKAKEVG